MSRTVRCEQVVLGWSHYSLLGGDGFGPVFASAGWPLPPGDRDAGLGEHARFLSSSGNSMIAEGRTPPRCLTYARSDAGTLLVSKAYAARSSRSGQYLVHALLDPSNTLRPQDLFACADKGLLLVEQPAGEADRAWPPVDVPLARTTPEPALDTAEEAALAVLLDCLSGSRTMVVQASDPDRARDLVRRLLTALPARLARDLSLSTFASEPDQSGLDLCVGVPPFSSARRVDVDLDGGGAAPASPAALTMAAALVTAEPHAELDQAETVADLVGWAQLQSGQVGDLGSDTIQQLLAGPLWRSFLDAVDRTGPTSLLLDCLLDPEIAPVLSRRLARPSRALSDQLARAVAQPVGLDVRGQGQLQDQLIASLGRKEFESRVLPGVLALARQGVPVKIASTAMADLVADAARAEDGVPVTAFAWYAETSAWSAMTDLRLEAWVVDGGPLPPGLRDACAREPVAFGAAVDAMIVDRRQTPAALIKRLREWPDADLEVLVNGLLETARTTRLFILDVLGARDPQVARPLLRQYWTKIAGHADFSPGLTALLEVSDDPKRSFWPWARA